MKEFVGLRLDPDSLNLIDQQARLNRRSRSDMIRIMVGDWLNHNVVQGQTQTTQSLGGLDRRQACS